MMEVFEVAHKPGTGEVYAAGPLTENELRLVEEDIDELDVIAADDIRVRVRPDHDGPAIVVEALSEIPLRVRRVENVVRVRTEFEPETPVEPGGLKEGVPVRPLE